MPSGFEARWTHLGAGEIHDMFARRVGRAFRLLLLTSLSRSRPRDNCGIQKAVSAARQQPSTVGSPVRHDGERRQHRSLPSQPSSRDQVEQRACRPCRCRNSSLGVADDDKAAEGWRRSVGWSSALRPLPPWSRRWEARKRPPRTTKGTTRHATLLSNCPGMLLLGWTWARESSARPRATPPAQRRLLLSVPRSRGEDDAGKEANLPTCLHLLQTARGALL
ncbi:unnamed protein product [Ixodes pacificus]